VGRRSNNLFDEIMGAPWWVGVGLAGIVYVSLKFVLPALDLKSPFVQGIARGISPFAWIFALPFLIGGIGSAIRRFIDRRRFDKQTSIESIRALTWQDFERLVGEYYRRQGYAVEPAGGGGPDGGVDLRLFKRGRKTVVQCKRWLTRQVGVTFVRELYGVMAAENANDAILVSSGNYSDDAREFANGKPIQLIDGSALLMIIRSVQPAPIAHHSSPIPGNADAVPGCPKCARPMLKRTARSGPNAGREFWGCPTYPQCRGTRSLV
jgi:restriction system protein